MANLSPSFSLLLALTALFGSDQLAAQEIFRANKHYELDLSATKNGVHIDATFTIQADGSAKLHVEAKNHSIIDNGEPRVQLECLDSSGATVLTLSVGELIPPRNIFSGPVGRGWSAEGKLLPGSAVTSIRWGARNVGNSWVLDAVKLGSRLLITSAKQSSQGSSAPSLDARAKGSVNPVVASPVVLRHVRNPHDRSTSR